MLPSGESPPGEASTEVEEVARSRLGGPVESRTHAARGRLAQLVPGNGADPTWRTAHRLVLELDLPRATAELGSVLRREVPQLADIRTDTQAIARARGRAWIALVCQSLLSGGDPFELPPDGVQFVRDCAEDGVELAALLRSCRIVHGYLVGCWSETARASLGSDPSPQLDGNLARRLSDIVDVAAAQIAEHHTIHQARLRTRSAERRCRQIRSVLEGNTDGEIIGYRLDQTHLALIVAGPDAADGTQEMLARFANASIALEDVESTTAIWLNVTALGRPSVERAMSSSYPGTCIAFGESADNAEGFRTTYRQAREAYAVARTLRRGELPSVRYRDVALCSATASHESSRQVFVQYVLGRLLGRGARERSLLRTLDCYLSHAQNSQATAAALKVHRATVANHLREIERRLGYAIHLRSAALQLALHIASQDPRWKPHGPG